MAVRGEGRALSLVVPVGLVGVLSRVESLRVFPGEAELGEVEGEVRGADLRVTGIGGLGLVVLGAGHDDIDLQRLVELLGSCGVHSAAATSDGAAQGTGLLAANWARNRSTATTCWTTVAVATMARVL